MQLTTFLLTAAAVLSLLQWGFIPRLMLPLSVERGPARIGKVATLSVLQTLRTIFLVALMAALFMAVFYGWLYLTRPGSARASEVYNLVARLSSWHEWLSQFRPIYTVSATVLLITALAILSYRASRRRMTAVFQEVYDREMQRLHEQAERGELEELPVTPELVALDQEIDQVVARAADQPDESDQAMQQRDYLGFLVSLRKAVDLRRRVHLELDSDEILEPPPRTLTEKLRTFFISHGLLQSLRGGSRLLFVTGLFLLFGSMLGVQGSAVSTVLERRILQFEELRLRLNASAARAEWEAAQQQAAARPLALPSNELSDEEAIAQLAHHFETAQMIGASTMAATQPALMGLAAPAQSLESIRVRQRILDTMAAKSPGQKLEVARSLGGAKDAQSLTPIEKSALATYEKAAVPGRPATALGERYAADLRQMRTQSPQLFGRIKGAFQETVRSFQVPARVADVRSTMAAQTLGTALGDAPHAADAGTELARMLQQNTDRAALFRHYETSRLRFESSLLRGEGLSSAVRSVSEARAPLPRIWVNARLVDPMEPVLKRVPMDVELQGAVRQSPPALRLRPELNVDTNKAVALTRDLIKNPRPLGSSPVEVTQTLASYESHFPSQAGFEAETVRGRMLEQLRTANGQNLVKTERAVPGLLRAPGRFDAPARPAWSPRFAPETTPTELAPFERARSMPGLRGYSGVGGVLIGNEPEPGPTVTLDFRDIRWSFANGAVNFILTRADGRELRVGPFRQNIARGALTYAADGRLTVVTILGASPLEDQKILLHPALSDTALGCRAADVDQIIREALNQNPAQKTAFDLLDGHNLLYRHSFSQRGVLLARHLYKQAEAAQSTERMQWLNQRFRALWGAQPILDEKSPAKRLVDQALQAPEVLRDPNRSPLAAKKEYFDQKLLADILECAQPRSTLDDFDKCLLSKHVEEIVSGGAMEDVWLGDAPSYSTLYHVRELPFTLDAELKFLQPTGGAQDVLGPFDFLAVIGFSSAPLGMSAEQAETAIDTTPWEFPSLKPLIRQEVLRFIEKQPAVRQELADLVEFTMAQRLFRVALNERLGLQFPIARLSSLGEALAAGARSDVPTARWSTRPGEVENNLAKLLDSALAEKKSDWRFTAGQALAARRCTQFIRTQTNRQSLALISDESWNSLCGPDALLAGISQPATAGSKDTLGALISRYAGEYSKVRQIRRVLGVHRDDAPRLKWSCPAP